MSNYMRSSVTWGNDFTIKIKLQQFVDGEYVDFDLTTVKSLEVYLICSTHNQKIPLEWELEQGYDNIISCFVDYRVTHPNTSYAITVEGIYANDQHFRWHMSAKEGILVVNNTSGQNIPQNVQIVDLAGRVGWGIQEGAGDLSNYYNKQQTNALLDEKQDTLISGTTIKTINNESILGAGNITIQGGGGTQVQSNWNETDTSDPSYIQNKPDLSTYATQTDLDEKQDTLISGGTIKTINNQSLLGSGNITIGEGGTFTQEQADWAQTDNSKVDYIKNKPDLSQYVETSDLNDYYTKVQTDGLLDNKVDTSTLTADYYTSNAVDNLLDNKVDNSDLANYYTQQETNTLLSHKASTTDLANKQDTLVSGDNIKTINNQSLLGSGNITIEGGGTQVQSNWNETDTSDPSYIQNKPDLSKYAETADLATVATTGDYADLTNKPTIPTSTSELTNDSGFLTSAVTSFNGATGAITYTAPVTSVNGMTGDVTYTAPVSSVNGMTGAVTIDTGVTSFNGATGAITYTAPVTSVNGQTGAVVIETGNKPFEQQYLTFEALEDGTFTFQSSDVQYSLDNGTTWVTLTAQTSTPTIITGNTISWKATGEYNTISNGGFTSTGNYKVFGNIMSMRFGDNFIGQNSLSSISNAFRRFFYKNTKLINIDNLILSATTLNAYCYYSMFEGCTALVDTSKLVLPATTLTSNCYASMFYGCTALTTAPELPATILAASCYASMFYGCTSLIEAPVLLATQSVDYCYESMFRGCTSLKLIICYLHDLNAVRPTYNWVMDVTNTYYFGTFVCADTASSMWASGNNGYPSNWKKVTQSQYNYVHKYELATVATTGNYNSLTNRPNLATVATSGSYNDLSNKPDLTQYATQTDLATKQDSLVSGTNIKTINNESLLGSGNIDIQSGGDTSELEANLHALAEATIKNSESLATSINKSVDEKLEPVNVSNKVTAEAITHLYDNMGGLKFRVVTELPSVKSPDTIYIVY